MTHRPPLRPRLHDQENYLPPPQLRLVILTLGVTLLVINVDLNGLSTLLPTVAQDLHASSSITWAGSSALIATTVFSVLCGRFSDIFGRKAVFVSALSVFALAELACGFAQNAPMLYALRALTGASGGGIGNLAAIIIADVISLRERGRYITIIAPFRTLGNVCGPLAAAAFVKSPLTWRGLFWVISPLAGLSAILAFYMLPSTTPTDSFKRNLAKVDWAGSLTSTIAIIAFMVPVSGAGTSYQWDSPFVISLLSVSATAFLIFVVIEWKMASLPILPLSLFAQPDVCALLMQTFTLGWVNQANVYFVPIYAQTLRGWSPVVSAALLLPIIAVQTIVAMLAGRWMSKSGNYGGSIRLGVALLLIGSLLETQFDRHTHPAAIVLTLFAIGVGVGAANQPMVVAMQAHTKKSERAVITSTRNFFRFLGSACGVAVSAAVLQSTLRMSLPTQYKHLANSPYDLGNLSPAAKEAIAPAYATAIRYVFVTGAGASALSTLGLLVWRDDGFEARPEEDDKYAPGLGSEEETEEDGPLLGDSRPVRPSYGALAEPEEGRDRRSAQERRPL